MSFSSSDRSLSKTTRMSCNIFVPAILMLTATSSTVLPSNSYYPNPKQKSLNNGITTSTDSFYKEFYTTPYTRASYPIVSKITDDRDILERYKASIPERMVRVMITNREEHTINFDALLDDSED